MSEQSDHYGVLPPQTESCKLRKQDRLVKLLLNELCGEEAEARSENVETVKTENRGPGKPEQDACSKTLLETAFETDGGTMEVVKTKPESYTTEETETAPSYPSSPSVIVLPDEENAEKNANFKLVFPYGHDFLLEGERALAVLVDKRNRENDESCQYEDYDEWLSRISQQHSPRRGQQTTLRGHELRGNNTTFKSGSSPRKNDADQLLVSDNSIPSSSQHDIVSDITKNQKSSPPLVEKTPQQVIKWKTDNRSLTDHDYCINSPSICVNPLGRPLSSIRLLADDDCVDSDKTKNCNVNNINMSPKTDQNSKGLYQVCARVDGMATLNNITDTMKTQKSRPRLVVKKAKQINEETAHKELQKDHNYFAESDKVEDCNVKNNTHIDQNMDQIFVNNDLTTVLDQHIVIHTKRSHEVSVESRLTVKKPEQINGPTLGKRKRTENVGSRNSEKNTDFNLNNTLVNNSSIPYPTQINKNQVCPSDVVLNTLQEKHVLPTRIIIESPKLTVKTAEQVQEPKSEGMRIDHNDCGNSNPIKDCNIDNVNISSASISCQEAGSNKVGHVRVSKDLPNTLHHNVVVDLMRNHDSHPKPTVKQPDLINKSLPDKIMQIVNNINDDSIKDNNNINISSAPLSCQEESKKVGHVRLGDDLPNMLHHNVVVDLTKNHDSQPKPTVKLPNQMNKSSSDKIMRIVNNANGDAHEVKHCNSKNIKDSFVSLSMQGKDNKKWASEDDVLVKENKKRISCLKKSQDSQTKLVVEQLNEPLPKKRMRIDNKLYILHNSNTSPTQRSSQDGNKNKILNFEFLKKNSKQVNEAEGVNLIDDDDDICKNSDIIRNCNINNTSSSPQKKYQVSVKKDEIIATLQNIALNIKKSREIRPKLVVKKGKLLNKPILKNKPRVTYYNDSNKTKNDRVKSIGDEAMVSNEDNFEWSTSMDSFWGVKESFAITQTGSVVSHDTIYDAFRRFWDDDILNTIARETNRHAKSASMSIPFNTYMQWYDTNMHEILILLTFWTMLGIIRMPSIESCFSNDPLLKMNVFKTMFTKTRYNNLVTALSFANNVDKSDESSEIQCISPILNHLNAKFKSNFIPCQNISIDNSCLTCDNSHTVGTKNNTVNFGIKTLELYDNATGYLWCILIHLEKAERDNVESQPGSKVVECNASVLKLIKPLLNKGYTLYMNILLNSPTLARFLKKNKTDCVGMIAPSLDGLPSFEGLANMRPKQFVAQHAKDICVIAWYNKNIIYYISTFHDTGRFISHKDDRSSQDCMPQVVVDCEQNLGVISNKNQVLEPYETEENRCDRSHMKLFKRLLNISIMNAQILLESSKKMKVDHLATRLQLVDSILEKHLSLCPVSKIDSRKRSKFHKPRGWRENGHWPVLYKLETTDTDRHNQTRCVYCFSRGFKNNKTRYKCEECDVPLCVLCFKGYHNSQGIFVTSNKFTK